MSSALPSVQGSTPQQGPTPQESREPDPSTSAPTKKRKRKTLACYDCRRRKLKCDRIFPACGRCVRAGQAGQCHYESLPDQAQDGSSESEEDCRISMDPNKVARSHMIPGGAVASVKTAPSEVTSPLSATLRGGKFDVLEERIARLEALSKNGSPESSRNAVPVHANSPYTPLGSALTNVEPLREPPTNGVEMIFFKGRGFHTQFWGPTNPTSMISQFPELRAFMKAAIRQYSVLARVQSDLKMLNQNLKLDPPVYKTSLSAALLAQVPERAVTDHLVNLYIRNLEVIYRVLHVPSFLTEYNHFWNAPQDARPSFIAILLLVISSVTSLASNSPKTFIGRSSQTRETSVKWVQVVDDWMDTQSRKHVTIESFQIWLLLAISKHMNIIKKKRSWETAGNIIKIFMGSGLHREPSILGKKITFFDQEMRRRIWASAVEWDLQASLVRGMPSSVAACPSDCAAPMNLDDKVFDETTIQPPRPRLKDEFSDSSFLHLASQSLRLRISLTSLVNDPGSHVEYDEILKWEEKIKQQLESVPQWDDAETMDSEDYMRSLLARVVLDVQLRQFLIWLHFPYASRAGSGSQNSYSRAACFNNACTIVDLHSKVMERENFSLCLLRNDAYVAAMTMCHNVFASSHNQDNIVFQSFVTSFPPSVEKALKMQEEKILRLGEGRNHYWFISAAASFVQTKISPDSAAASKQKAVERVTRLLYNILTGQEDYNGSSAIPKTPSVDSGAQQPLEAIVPSNPKDLEQLDNLQINGVSADFDPFQHLDPAEWALDNLWPIDNLDWPQV